MDIQFKIPEYTAQNWDLAPDAEVRAYGEYDMKRGRPKGIPSHRRGLTLEEEYGEKRAKEIRDKIIKSVKENPKIKRTWFKKGHPLYHSRKGEHHTDDVRRKLSLAHKGKKNSKLSEYLKQHPRTPWNKGLTKKSDIRIKEISERNSRYMKNFYKRNFELRYKRLREAHKRVRELVKEGRHIFQRMERHNCFTKPSKPQIELYNIVKSLFPDAELEYGIKEIGRKADIAIPSLKLDVEYDEPYWHNSEEDKQRDSEFRSIGWTVIRIGPDKLQNLKSRRYKHVACEVESKSFIVTISSIV